MARRPSTSKPPSLRAQALRALALREHSRSELRRKLLRRADADGEKASADEVEPLLDALERDGLLSEARFVESRVRVRAPKLGAARIAGELARHGLDLPPEAAAALAASEVERAHAVWQRRFGAPAADAGERARQARFLLSRGFAADTVRRVIRGLESDAGP